MSTEHVHDVPFGHRHIDLVGRLGRLAEAQSSFLLSEGANAELSDKIGVIGTSLTALYQAATCYRKCFGGDHVIEALCGRAYNLGCGAYHLISVGLYDEAFALIKGLGELGNLISAIVVVDPTILEAWVKSDKKARRNKFGPAAIRRLLKEHNAKPLLYADDDWYGDLSETYIHVSPEIKPNKHGGGGPVVGGIFQRDGAIKAINELTMVLGLLALATCEYFDMMDLFEEIKKAVRGTQT